MSFVETFPEQDRPAPPFHIKQVVAASILVASCAALAIFGLGLIWLVLVGALLLLAVCLHRPYIAVIIFVGSSFFVQTDLAAGGISIHLPDVGFLIVIAVFAIREGHRINLKMAQQPVILVCLLVVFVSCMAGINGYLSGNSPVLIPGDLRPMLYYLSVWPICKSLPNDRIRGRVVLWICLLAVCGIGWGMWQDATNPDFFGYSISFGPVTFGRLVFPLMPTFIPMQFGLLAVILLMSGEKRYRGALMITMIVALAGLFLSLTRGAIVGFVVGIVAVNTIAQGYLFSWRKMVVFAVLIGCTAWGLDSVTNNIFSSRLIGTSAADENVASRLYETGLVFGKIQEKPILGSGLGALHSPDQPLQPDEKTDLRTYLNPTYVHDFYLWAWFKLGISGLLTFITLIVTALVTGVRAYKRATFKSDKSLALAATAIIAATAITSITSPMLNDELTVPPTILTLALCCAIYSTPTPSTQRPI